MPTVVVADGRATFRQEGRPELVVSGIHGSLAAVPSGRARLVARGDDPDRGRWDVVGAFAAGFREGQVDLTGRKIETSPEQVARIPVVPGEVWQNVIPRGLVDVRLTIRLASGTAQPIRVRTVVNLRQTALKLPALGLDLAETTGEVVVEGGVVHLDRLAGRAVGGRVGTTGMMDFSRTPPRFDLHLDLDRVAVAAAPEAWQLDERGMTGGQMTGKAQLVVTLAPGDVDLSGSSGEAVITGGMVHGVPVKSLRLIVHGDGADLHSGTGVRDRAGRGVAPVAHGEPSAGPRPSGGGMRLPESVSTEIELEDVDLSPLVAQARAAGDRPAGGGGRAVGLEGRGDDPVGEPCATSRGTPSIVVWNSRGPRSPGRTSATSRRSWPWPTGSWS